MNMTKQSIVEWASEWVPEVNRERFAKALSDELKLLLLLEDAAPQASNGSPQGSGVGQRQTAPKGEVAESDNAPAAVAAPVLYSDMLKQAEAMIGIPEINCQKHGLVGSKDGHCPECWTDWQTPIMDGYRMECCDCGLVHEVEFRVYKVEERPSPVETYGPELPPNDYRVQMRMKRL